jgi:hypothetical protein
MDRAAVSTCALAAGLLVANGGCAAGGEPLTPDAGMSGVVYVLRSVGDAAVPTLWISNESVSIVVLADTIRLGAGGRGERALVERYEEQAPLAPATRREAGPFDYVRRGDQIEITLPCPDLAICMAPPHFVGRVATQGLVVDRALNYRTPIRYERVTR